MITYVIKSVEDFEIFYNYYQSKSLIWSTNGRPVFTTLTIHTYVPYTLCLAQVDDGYHVLHYRGLPSANGITSDVSLLPKSLTATEVFTIFLKHRRKYSSYLRQGGQAFTGIMHPHAFVNAMDEWCHTKEGLAYWISLRTKWILLCKELNVE